MSNEQQPNIQDIYEHVYYMLLENIDNDELSEFKSGLQYIQEEIEFPINFLSPDTEEDFTLLMYSTNQDKPDFVKFILEKGADPEIKNLKQLDAIQYLLHGNDNLELFKYLLENGSDIHVKDGNNSDLLQQAVLYNRPKIAKYLIDSGMSFTRKNDYNETTLDMINRLDREEIKNCIKN